MNLVKQREKQRKSFVDGILSVALAHGVTKQEIKREAFSSYGTGNRRIEHNQGDITLSEILNIATLCRLPPAELLTQAAANMKAKQ